MDTASAQNHGTGRKIRSLDNIHDFFDIRCSVIFDTVIDDLYHAVNGLPEIMRRDIGGHADRDTGRTIDQKIGKTGRHNNRLFFRIIKVWNKVDRIFIDVCHHLHGDLAQTGLCVSHGRCPVTVHGTEIAVSVNQGIAHIPVLGHIDQGTVNR